MGVVNTTPDSFSDGGLYKEPPRAIDRAMQLAIQGADIIDIGAESSRPGADPVSAEEEMKRAIPVIMGVKEKAPIKISIDTYKSEVAERAIEAGASMVNDISAMTADPQMVKVVADSGVDVILMHMLGTPRTMQVDPCYDDVLDEVCEYLSERTKYAIENGVDKEKIYVDPGIGFGKRLVDNLTLLAGIKEIKKLGFPVVIGTSRKSFIEKIIGKKPPSERLLGSLGSFAWAAIEGADILRVHNISETYETIAVVEAIKEHSTLEREVNRDSI